MLLKIKNRQVSAFYMPHMITGLNHFEEPTDNVWMIPVAVVPYQYLYCWGHQCLFGIVAHIDIIVRTVDKEKIGNGKVVHRSIAEMLRHGFDGCVCQLLGAYAPRGN